MCFIYKTEIEPKVKKFMGKVLFKYDLSKFNKITFSKAKRSSGRCYYPVKKVRGRERYKITCSIPSKQDRMGIQYVLGWDLKLTGLKGTLKDYVSKTPKKIHRVMDGGKIYSWRLQVAHKKENYIRGIYDIYEIIKTDVEYLKFENKEEEVIWLFGHELFHFLRHTKQVEGRNTQNQADGFGIKLVKEWRKI